MLRWLGDGHYTLLGYRRYTIDGSDGDRTATGVESSSLGVLRDAGQHGDGPEPVGERDLVALTQGPNPATVHRAVYPYFVSVIDADDSAAAEADEVDADDSAAAETTANDGDDEWGPWTSSGKWW